MPASTKLINGKWRVIEPGGGILLNKGGTAADGGGHSSKDKAEAQARAINASKHGKS